MAAREKYLWAAAVTAAALSACTTGTLSDPPGDGAPPGVPAGPQAFKPPAPTIRRLLARQYKSSVRDLLGDGAAAAATPPADSSLNGFDAIGAAQLGVSDDAVTKYEVSARAVAAAAMGDTARIGTFLSCDPASPGDAAAASACRKDFARSFGRLAFRRPLDTEEVDRYAGVAEVASAELGDFNSGIEYAILAFLQSPSFLYQVEIGTIDPTRPTLRRLDGYEMASRMSYFLVGSTPSPELLDAAEKGALNDAEGARKAALALLARPEARAALDSFYAELLRLRDLDSVVKDANAFPQFSPKLAQAMREETLHLIDDIVWDQNSDYRDVLDADYTFVNGDLAALYGLPAPEGDGSDFIKVQLPEDQKRGGLLGQASFLSLFSHTSLSSPTLRGKFVRERLLCQAIPAPPANVNTVLPSDPNAKTARQKLEVHQTAPGCKSCHVAMDLIGFGLENYDAVGAFRTTENGETIDAKSEIAGMGSFDGARQLGGLLREQPEVTSCVVRNIFRSATGHIDTSGESPALKELDASFADSGYRMQDLLVELVASDAFRLVGVVE
jgi:PAS domain-containing protein